jgi:probable phosphoglycerate mutase
VPTANDAPLADDTALWLVRHGETEWSRTGQHTGRTEIPLTRLGEEQAEALRPWAARLRPALVLCSPRGRALDTARLAGLQVDDVDDDLAEWDYGDYEGLTSEQIHTQIPGWTLFDDGVPHGETAAQIRARADRALARARQALSIGPVVFVAHGHIGRVLGARWIGLDVPAAARLALGTATLSLLGAEHGQAVIARWNMPNSAEGGR